MKKGSEEFTDRVLNHIEKDRLRPPDHFFATRLMAKAEGRISAGASRRPSVLYLKLKPVVTVAVLVLGIFAGIFLGSLLGWVSSVNSPSTRAVRLDQYAKENHITEINGSLEENLISK